MPQPTTERDAKRRERGKALAKALSAPTEIIALLPGFLGFDRLGGFGYFADHMAATLRGAFELKSARRTPVVALSTLPSASLRERQRELFRQLSFWTEHYGVSNVKLVGHSTGGVDAYFALASKRLDGSAWDDSERRLRDGITHVVTMGAPFLGTTLADAPLSRGAYSGRLMLPALRDLARVGRGAFGEMRSRELYVRAMSLSQAPAAVAKFLTQLISHRDLLAELTPLRMLEMHDALAREHGARLSCFASWVQSPDPAQASDLFCTLYDLTSKAAGACSSAHILEHCKLLETVPVIGQPLSQKPELDAHSSDGVVNTLRQLPPGVKREEIGALVLADHADLLGYFDRFDPRTGQETQTSIFRSGARFRDDEFFELFARVARCLL